MIPHRVIIREPPSRRITLPSPTSRRASGQRSIGGRHASRNGHNHHGRGVGFPQPLSLRL